MTRSMPYLKDGCPLNIRDYAVDPGRPPAEGYDPGDGIITPGKGMIKQPEKKPQEPGDESGDYLVIIKIVLYQTLTLTFHSQYNCTAIKK